MIIHRMAQGSPEWHEIKLAKVSSTRLKSVIAPKSEPSKVIDELIAEDISGQSDDDGYVNDDMQRGIDLEPIAAKDYAAEKGYELDHVGFLQSSRWDNLGVSADRLIGKDGAVEIKCPKTKTHVRYIRDNAIPSEYKYQVLNYFIVHEDLQWLDFVSYDPRFIVCPMFIKRVTREELADQIEAAMVKLEKFFTELEEVKNRIVFGVTAADDDAAVAILTGR